MHDQGHHGRTPRKKPWINKLNRGKIIEFSKLLLSASKNFFQRIILSDESKFNIFGSDGKLRVWRKSNAELQSTNLTATVKHGGGSVLVWGCFSSFGVGKLVFIDRIMDHKAYIDILKNNLKDSANIIGLGDDYIFQQDNDPKHTAYNTRMWLLYNVPKRFATPPQSPDLNPIENLWAYPESQLRKHDITSREQLKRILQQEWANIPVAFCAKWWIRCLTAWKQL